MVKTGEPVYRETVLDGAVLTRVAASHIRVGTMQWAAAHDDHDGAAGAGGLHAGAPLPGARRFAGAAPRAVRRDPRTAGAPDRPLAAGRLHPWRDEHRQHGALRRNDRLRPVRVHGRVRSRHGVQLHRPRRAIRVRQPAVDRAVEPRAAGRSDAAAVRSRTSIAPWSAPRRRSTASRTLFEQHWLDGMRAKLGLFTQEDGRQGARRRPPRLDAAAVGRLHEHLPVADRRGARRGPADATNADPEVEAWHRRLAARRGRQPQSPAEAEDLMRRHNPAFIPRNHNVEEALQAATGADDYSVMERLLDVLATPYDHGRDLPMFSTPGPRASGPTARSAARRCRSLNYVGSAALCCLLRRRSPWRFSTACCEGVPIGTSAKTTRRPRTCRFACSRTAASRGGSR